MVAVRLTVDADLANRSHQERARLASNFADRAFSILAKERRIAASSHTLEHTGFAMPHMDDSTEWIAALERRLLEPLPGAAAHRKFPHELSYGRHAGPAPPHARVAAVLILLYPDAGRWHIPLILRPATMTSHGGQIGFPGGTLEPGETLEACAGRETEEELGLNARNLRSLGRLSELYIYASNYRVTPCLAVTNQKPEYRVNQAEVAAVLSLPLDMLWSDSPLGQHVVRRGGVDFLVPHFEWEGCRIWGATRMMLGELQRLVDDCGRKPLY